MRQTLKMTADQRNLNTANQVGDRLLTRLNACTQELEREYQRKTDLKSMHQRELAALDRTKDAYAARLHDQYDITIKKLEDQWRDQCDRAIAERDNQWRDEWDKQKKIYETKLESVERELGVCQTRLDAESTTLTAQAIQQLEQNLSQCQTSLAQQVDANKSTVKRGRDLLTRKVTKIEELRKQLEDLQASSTRLQKCDCTQEVARAAAQLQEQLDKFQSLFDTVLGRLKTASTASPEPQLLS